LVGTIFRPESSKRVEKARERAILSRMKAMETRARRIIPPNVSIMSPQKR
jgi:hypothetical protein